MKQFYTCFFSCQVENTLSFALILRANYERIVENFLLNLWKILWKTSQVFSITEFKNPGNFDNARYSLCKSVKIVREKNFQIEKKLVSGQFFGNFWQKFVQNANCFQDFSSDLSNSR